MDIDAVFLPVAEELIDQVFPTPITYLLTAPPAYDPSTGESVPNATEYMINAGILSRGKNEGGGVDGEYELRLWIHHGDEGLPALPTTRDRVFYDGTFWKVVRVDPTYSSDDLIASKLLVRAE
jgi:hypothetical protein